MEASDQGSVWCETFLVPAVSRVVHRRQTTRCLLSPRGPEGSTDQDEQRVRARMQLVQLQCEESAPVVQFD
jgi:hypothetical protein